MTARIRRHGARSKEVHASRKHHLFESDSRRHRDESVIHTLPSGVLLKRERTGSLVDPDPLLRVFRNRIHLGRPHQGCNVSRRTDQPVLLQPTTDLRDNQDGADADNQPENDQFNGLDPSLVHGYFSFFEMKERATICHKKGLRRGVS